MRQNLGGGTDRITQILSDDFMANLAVETDAGAGASSPRREEREGVPLEGRRLDGPNLEALLDIPVKLSVELGTAQLSMQEVLQLGPGSVVQLDKPADAPVDIYVNQKLVARGEVVVMEEQFGIKVTEIVGKQG